MSTIVAVAVLRTPSGCLEVLVSLTQGGGVAEPWKEAVRERETTSCPLRTGRQQQGVLLNRRSVETSEDMKPSEKTGRCLVVPDVVFDPAGCYRRGDEHRSTGPDDKASM